jgi:Domain of unknown function (DUF4136)
MTSLSSAGGRRPFPAGLGRFPRIVAASLLALGLAAATAAAETPAYGVSLKVAKKAELAKVKSYSWGVSHAAIDKAVDSQIVTAIERELAALGLTKVTQGSGDALVAYHTVVRRDVDTKKQTAKDEVPGYLVGVIGIEVRAASTKDLVFHVRIDKPIDVERSQIGPVVDAAVKAMFERYPRPSAP